MLGVVRGGAGAPSGMRAFPAAVERFLRCDTPRRTILERFSEDADILADLAHLQQQPTRALCRGHRAGWRGWGRSSSKSSAHLV